jgi:di/tricarboxylate transporter
MIERIFLGVLLCVAIYFFWTQKLRSDLTAVLVMLSLVIPWPHPDGQWRGILTAPEGFSGFGSSAVIMVTAMFIFGGALVKTGAVEMIGARFFKKFAGREWTLQTAILAMSALVSMFVNDTTVVLIFLPLVLSICRERKLSPSRYLMPAAYGSILGGQWTLIGTRSNILISDYYRQHTGHSLGFFDFTPVAAVIFVIATIYFVLIGKRVLPNSAPSSDEKDQREYLTEVVVTEQSAARGKSLDGLDWSRREDVEVVEILRDHLRLASHDALQPGDRLVIRGAAKTMGDLLKTPDFKLKEEIEMDPKTLQRIDLVTVEALLSPGSRYSGASLQELKLSRRYGFTVLGISRRGQMIRKFPLSTRLQFGDSLLLLGPADDVPQLRRNPNLILLTEESFPAIGKRKALVMLFLLCAIIGLAISDAVNPAISIPAAAFLAVIFGCIRIQDAYGTIDWQAVVTVAGMIPFGLAMEKTKTAGDLAQYFVQTFSGFGPHAILAAVLGLAILMTQLLDNAGVAIILAPIAYGVSEAVGANPKTFLVAMAICISATFCIPFGHESTILVMGPGQYRFKHYLQIGIGLVLITWLLATLLTPLVWPLGAKTNRNHVSATKN